MMNSRRNMIKGAAMTATGVVVGVMSPLKSQEVVAQQPTLQSSESVSTNQL